MINAMLWSGDVLQARVAGALATCRFTDKLTDEATTQLIEHTTAWLQAKKPATRIEYLRALASWWRYCYTDPREMKSYSLLIWLDSALIYSPTPLKDRSATTYLAVISSWYKYLQARHVCPDNPASGIRAPYSTPSAPATPSTTPQPHTWTPSPAATATMVELALDRAERSRSERAWRDCATVSLLFYAGVTLTSLIRAQMSDLLGLSDLGRALTLWTRSQEETTGAFVDLPPVAARHLTSYLTLRSTRLGRSLLLLRGPLLSAPTRAHNRVPEPTITSAQLNRVLVRLAHDSGISLPPEALLSPVRAIAWECNNRESG
ncbi:hypothetical protein [Nonomuraea typhae]|uniref:Core-binding (CB) domain-containing protein n=1 Tax=Nonomuraea typhae TaxID=2603600 RepID=A0ABW7Z764_9ACTN